MFNRKQVKTKCTSSLRLNEWSDLVHLYSGDIVSVRVRAAELVVMSAVERLSDESVALI